MIQKTSSINEIRKVSKLEAMKRLKNKIKRNKEGYLTDKVFLSENKKSRALSRHLKE